MEEFTKDELELLMQLGIIPDQLTDLEEQLKQANIMRQGEGMPTLPTAQMRKEVEALSRGMQDVIPRCTAAAAEAVRGTEQ